MQYALQVLLSTHSMHYMPCRAEIRCGFSSNEYMWSNEYMCGHFDGASLLQLATGVLRLTTLQCKPCPYVQEITSTWVQTSQFLLFHLFFFPSLQNVTTWVETSQVSSFSLFLFFIFMHAETFACALHLG